MGTTRETSPHRSVAELLRTRAQLQPERAAILAIPQLAAVTETLTYADLHRRAAAVAARLVTTTRPGERVLVLCENDPSYLDAFFGCALAGRVAVTLHPPTQRKQLVRLAHVARDCDAAVVLATRAVRERYQRPIDDLPEMPALAWQLVDEAGDGADPGVHPDASDAAFLQYTSGSTGAPRGVIVRHGDLMYQGAYQERGFRFTPDDLALSWLPLFHDMGLILGLLQGVYTGYPVALANPAAFVKNPDRWLRRISDLRVTFTGGPNFAYDLCCDAVDPATLDGVDLSSWTRALNAAEPIRAATLRRFTHTFSRLGFRWSQWAPGYGLAEATLAVSTTPPGGVATRTVDPAQLGAGVVADDPSGRELVCSGRVVPDTEVAVVEPTTGVRLPADRVGELWVAAGGLPAGYWEQPAATAATFQATLDGDPRPWLRTGDLGFLDGDRLYVTGRVKDVIIAAGRNHYPSDLEETAEAASSAVRPSFTAAFAAEDGERERVVLVAEVRREALIGVDALSVGRAISSDIGRFHELALDEVLLVAPGQLPKTTSGKVQRRQCRDLWATGGFEVVGRWTRGGVR